jgi:hypothetical protein
VVAKYSDTRPIIPDNLGRIDHKKRRDENAENIQSNEAGVNGRGDASCSTGV